MIAEVPPSVSSADWLPSCSAAWACRGKAHKRWCFLLLHCTSTFLSQYTVRARVAFSRKVKFISCTGLILRFLWTCYFFKITDVKVKCTEIFAEPAFLLGLVYNRGPSMFKLKFKLKTRNFTPKFSDTQLRSSVHLIQHDAAFASSTWDCCLQDVVRSSNFISFIFDVICFYDYHLSLHEPTVSSLSFSTEIMASPAPLPNANTAFSQALLKKLSDKDNTANVFFSPFSISSALSMVMLGARGNTAVQMSEVMQHFASAQAFALGSLRKQGNVLEEQRLQLLSSTLAAALLLLQKLFCLGLRKSLWGVTDTICCGAMATQ